MSAVRNEGSHRTNSPALSRRALLRWAGWAGVGLALGACSNWQPFANRRARQKAQLVYQDWRTEWFPPMAQQMLEQFHATHPNIRVFYTPDPANLEEQMLADMQAGTAADVFQGCCAHFPIWAQKGYCLDLRSYVTADLDKATIADWDPVQYRYYLTQDGRQYALPKYHGALALYYNKDAFDAGKVGYPDGSWSYDDYAQAMKRLSRDTDGDGKVDQWGSMIDVSWERIQVHVNAWGGHFVDPDDPARCMMGEPEALEAVSWIRSRVWQDGTMATPHSAQSSGTSEAFASGKLAMVEDGSWALKYILTEAPFRIGVAPMPKGPVRRATLATTDGFAIYSGTQYPEAAWELIKFLVSADYGRAMAQTHFLQPARASLLDEWAGFVRADYPEKAREMDINAFADGHLNGYSVTAEVFANMNEARRIANDAWDRVLTLGDAPLNEIEAACQRIGEAQKGG